MGVVVKDQPWQALSLFQYLDLIYRVYVDFVGQAWLSYDKEFHMRSAIHPNLRWDEPLAGLWLQLMTPARPNLGDRTDSEHLIRNTVVNVTPPVNTGQVLQPHMLCFEYNAKGACSKKQCRFRHECTVCGGQHSSATCFRAGALRQAKGPRGGKRPSSRGSNAGKGAQSN